MGLDMDIVKFSKEFFDTNATADLINRSVDYNDAQDNYEQLAYYRKGYLAQYKLCDDFGMENQLVYYELTKPILESLRDNPVDFDEDESEYQKECYQRFLKDITKILEDTDFNKEVISYKWIS
jgi:hypothetical protein